MEFDNNIICGQLLSAAADDDCLEYNSIYEFILA